MEKEIQIPDGFEAKIEGSKVVFVPKDSEDERVRKALLRCCDDWEKGQFGCFSKEDVPAVRAWLEKQKTSEEAIRYLKENHSSEKVSDFQAAMNIAVARAYDKGVQDTLEKQKEQKPAEWSEEDEKIMIRRIIGLLKAYLNSNSLYAEEAKECIDWLKSLRPQPHWKPSEEQVEAFGESLLSVAYTENRTILQSLYNDLKKLI